MPVLTIRRMPAWGYARLRVRAARGRRSMEAEARAILTSACQGREVEISPASLQDWVDSLYRGAKPRRVVSALLAERRREAERE